MSRNLCFILFIVNTLAKVYLAKLTNTYRKEGNGKVEEFSLIEESDFDDPHEFLES